MGDNLKALLVFVIALYQELRGRYVTTHNPRFYYSIFWLFSFLVFFIIWKPCWDQKWYHILSGVTRQKRGKTPFYYCTSQHTRNGIALPPREMIQNCIFRCVSISSTEPEGQSTHLKGCLKPKFRLCLCYKIFCNSF